MDQDQVDKEDKEEKEDEEPEDQEDHVLQHLRGATAEPETG